MYEIFLEDFWNLLQIQQYKPPNQLLIIMQGGAKGPKSDEDMNIQFFIKQFGKQKIIGKFTNEQIFQQIKSRGVISFFLLQVKASYLRDALEINEQIQKMQNKQQFKINILDLTVNELKKHCQSIGLINYNQYNLNYSHKQLGMMLLHSYPEKYYLGSKSHHFNRAKEIQAIYGIQRNNADQLQDQQQEEQKDQGSDFINDQVQQSNYQQSEIQQSNQQIEEESQQVKDTKKKKKMKKPIKKLQNKTKAKKKITDYFKLSKQKQKNQQIYMQQEEQDEQIAKYEIKLNKTSEKSNEQKKQYKGKTHINKKRNIDSDEQG